MPPMTLVMAVVLSVTARNQPPSDQSATIAVIHNLTDHPAEVWADDRYLGQVPALASGKSLIATRDIAGTNGSKSRGIAFTIATRVDDTISLNALVVAAETGNGVELVWGGLDPPQNREVVDISSTHRPSLGHLFEQRWPSLSALPAGQPTPFAQTLLGMRHDNARIVGQTLSGASGDIKQASTSFGSLLRRVPKGAFQTGTSLNGRRDSATLSQDFYMSVTEITRGQLAYLSQTATLPPEELDLPAINVTWQGAVDACSSMGAIGTWSFHIPTEAQWEYACQAGKLRRYSPDTRSPLDVMWCSANSGGRVHPVATRLPNEFGIFDLHGNVREWCRDWWSRSPPNGTDPMGPGSGSERVRRGGAFDTPMEWCGSGFRDAGIPDIAQPWQGFRIVLDTNAK